MPEPLPPHAQEWMQQWRYAAEHLPQIRAKELRKLTDEQSIQLLGVLDVREVPQPQRHGLVTQQSWFMRMRIRQLQGMAK